MEMPPVHSTLVRPALFELHPVQLRNQVFGCLHPLLRFLFQTRHHDGVERCWDWLFSVTRGRPPELEANVRRHFLPSLLLVDSPGRLSLPPAPQALQPIPGRVHVRVPAEALLVIADGCGRVPHDPVEVGKLPGPVQRGGVDLHQVM